jgi:hypothetical protein
LATASVELLALLAMSKTSLPPALDAAVKLPCASIVPTAGFPFAIPLTNHCTGLPSLEVAVNWVDWPAATTAEVGETATLAPGPPEDVPQPLMISRHEAMNTTCSLLIDLCFSLFKMTSPRGKARHTRGLTTAQQSLLPFQGGLLRNLFDQGGNSIRDFTDFRAER